MKRAILILAMVLLPLEAEAWEPPLPYYDIQLPGDCPQPYTRNWIQLSPECRCYNQVKHVMLWSPWDKTKDDAVNEMEMKLNTYLKAGWQLQEPYHGESDVWLVREVCDDQNQN